MVVAKRSWLDDNERALSKVMYLVDNLCHDCVVSPAMCADTTNVENDINH